MHIRLSPHILVRKAALPYALLAEQRPQQSREAIRRWLALSEQAGLLAAELADFLYDFIPTVTDDQGRHQLMSLRRTLKKQKNPLKLLTDDCLRLLPLTQLEQLSQLADHWQWLQQARAQAEQALQQDMQQRLRPALRASLADADFVHALAINNPRLYQKALKPQEWADGKTGSSKTERSLFSYMARAAAKTSPLSTFMANLSAGFQPDAASSLELDQLETHIHPEINRGVIARICRFCQQDLRWFRQIRLQKNPSLQWQHSAVSLLANVHIELLGRPWRQQQPLQARRPGWLAELLQQLPDQFDWTALAALLAARPGVDPQAQITQLLDLDIVTPVTLWHGQEQQPLPCLLAELRQHGTEAATALISELEQLQGLEQQFASADGPVLAQLCQQIDRLIDQIYLRIGARFVEPYQSNFSETVWQQGARIRFGKGLYRLAEQMGRSVADRIRLDPAYAVLQQAFIEQFGAGGQCDDVLAFLQRQQPQFRQRLQACQQDPQQYSQAAVGITLYGQLLCQDLSELESQQPQLVLNLLYERLGWQACRYLPVGHPAVAETADRLADWLSLAAEDGAEVVEIALSSECNALQSHRYVTARVLGWPGESVHPERCLDISQLVLRHDAAHNQLKFFRRDGQPVQLCYLGAVLPQPDWGLSYLLIKLTEPFHLVRPQHLFQVQTAAADVEHTARICEGDLVLYRETWRVRRQALQALAAEMPEVERLKLAEQFRRQHQLPEVCFVSGELGLSALDAQEQQKDRFRKPMWFDFSNPFCLEHLLKLLDACERVTFREALPAADQLWFRQGQQSYVTELQMELQVTTTQVTTMQEEQRHVA